MKFCQPHWDALRAGVEHRGMTHLVAKSGKDAAEATLRELEGQSTVADWDPLMAAHWALANRVLQRMGPNALSAIADPDWCPLCEIQRSYDWWDRPEAGPRPPEALDAQGWADSCLDGMLKYAREQKLVPVQQ